jgi:predicted Zn-dependent protease
VRAFAERELHVPVRTLEKPKLAGQKSFQTLEKSAQRVKTDADVTLIVLAGFNGESQHLAVYPQSGIAVINAQALYTDDAEKFARRIERQVMRAAAFSFGLPPTPDPFCVTRDYRSLEDLDLMGRNFSPPWQGRFADEAAKRGLTPVDGTGEKGGARLPQ